MADDGHNDGADGQGIYDPFLVPDDFDDDVFYLLDMNGGMDAPPLQAAPAGQSAIAAGPSGDYSLLEWSPPTLDYINDSAVDNSAPTHNAALLADYPITASGAQDVGAAAGTSATAPRPSSSSSTAVHQNASLDCAGCQVLREVVHCNGLEATKLGVHGVPAGVFHHATLEAYRIDSNVLAAKMTTQLTHQSYVDFRGRDYVWVKHYLTDYAQQRAVGGYVVFEDSISAFQDALCTSMVCAGGHADDHREAVAQEINGGDADDHREAVALEINGGHQRVVGDRPDDDGGGAVQAPAMVEVEEGSVPAEAPAGPSSKPVANKEQGRRPDIRPAAKTALAVQRERASNLQLDDIARYFHLPMVEAAKELRICATVIKGTSRKFHIRRWPYRKVKSIDSQIAKLRRANGDPAAMREIERLTDYRRRIYAGLE